MQSKLTSKWILWFTIGIIIAISYRLFSSRYYALLNSDDALNVVMTAYYKLPQDIYCWGQNRGGTIIPLIAQLFYKAFNFSAINSVSLANYLLLITGFLCFCSIFKNDITKIIFAICWFLPPVWFIDLLRFPYGMEYCLIGIAVYLINILKIVPGMKLTLRQHLIMAKLVIILTISVWTCDLAIISIFTLFAVLFCFRKSTTPALYKAPLFYFLTGAAVCISFILYAKKKSNIENDEYVVLNTFPEAIEGLKSAFQPVKELLIFDLGQPVMSLYAWLVIVLITVLSLLFRRVGSQFSRQQKQWFCFFLLDALLIFTVVLFSHWARLDGYGRRFFIPVYISLTLVLLIFTDHILTLQKKKALLVSLLVISAVSGFFSTLHFIQKNNRQGFASKYNIMEEFTKLGKCFIVADYWSSYIVSIADPENVIAIPEQNNRNQHMLKQLQKEKYIYLMKDNWLEVFPLKTTVYWHLYYKDGNSFVVGGKTLCKYRKIR
ncbi:MAG: hypothetical protein K0Q95_3187 [Bacteroidota bacterium]|jgi:hypothetical protein|nr:hypothetical protein [Bacteroidota bacterium]